jgi:hypothetical protein
MSGHLRLRLLSRPGCCLCDELEEELLAEFGAAAFELERLDVDSREDWRAAYGRRIPVLLGEDDAVLSEGRLEAQRVASVLRP